MSPDEAAIEEYKALRAEILELYSRRISRLTVVWAGVSALIAAGAVSRVPEFGCIALLIVCSGWMDELRWFSGMIRIASYIRIVLEPQIEGLQWETITSSIRPRLEQGFLKRLLNTLFSTYGLFAIACISASIILVLEYALPSLFRRIAFFSLSFLGVSIWISAITQAMSIRRKKQDWERSLREHKSA